MTNRDHVTACLEAAGDAAEEAGFTDLAVAIDHLQLMFATGLDTEAAEALVLASEPIRDALLKCGDKKEPQ